MDTETKQILISIDNRLKRIEESMSIMKEDTNKWHDHIDFIEQLYSAVKGPLSYLLPQINNVSANNK